MAGLLASDVLRKMKLPVRGLTRAQMGELEEILKSEELPKDSLGLVALEGFFTALAIGPVEVLPGDWIRVIWGSRGDLPIFPSREEAKRVLGLVTRFYIDLEKIYYAQGMKPVECDYDPLLAHCWRKEDELYGPVDKWWALGRILAPGIEPRGGPYVSGYEWCAGFYRGFHLKSEAWKPLCEDREHAQLLMPILWFINDDLRRETCAGRDPEAVHQEMLLAIAASVKAINIYWRMREENAHQELLDQFDDQCRQILCQNTAPGEERQRALAEFEKAGGRRTSKGAKSRKLQREKVLNTALKTVLKALGGGTPLKLRTESLWHCDSTSSLSRTGSKPRWGENDPCPCGSGNRLRECCRFVN